MCILYLLVKKMFLQENRDCPLKLWLNDFSSLVALIINVYSHNQ